MLCELLSVDIALLITLLLITLSIINVRQFVFSHFAKLQRTNTLSDKVIVSLFIPLSHHMYKNLATFLVDDRIEHFDHIERLGRLAFNHSWVSFLIQSQVRVSSQIRRQIRRQHWPRPCQTCAPGCHSHSHSPQNHFPHAEHGHLSLS